MMEEFGVRKDFGDENGKLKSIFAEGYFHNSPYEFHLQIGLVIEGDEGPTKPVDLIFELSQDNQIDPHLMKFDPGVLMSPVAICIATAVLTVSYKQVRKCYRQARKRSTDDQTFKQALIACLQAEGGGMFDDLSTDVARCLAGGLAASS